MRAPKQVLVIPYNVDINGNFRYCMLRREDLNVWQWISGGVEGQESFYNAAIRESEEEIGISNIENLITLDTTTSIPSYFFSEHTKWPQEQLLVIEKSFGLRINSLNIIKLSDEHTEFKWVTYNEALKLLKWDSNKTALWELDQKLRMKLESL